MPDSAIDALVARTAQDQQGLNTVVVLTYPVRFQFAPGAADGLGIQADFVAKDSNGTEIANGTTDANGEVQIPIMSLFAGPVTVTILDTDYVFGFKPLQSAEVLAGLQQRLDMLGYLSGYQLKALDGAPTDDGKDGPETQQSNMNFQCDENLALDGVIGPKSKPVLVSRVGL